MVKNREKQKKPIIGVAYGVMQGNLHASHKALPADGIFVCIQSVAQKNTKKVDKIINK